MVTPLALSTTSDGDDAMTEPRRLPLVGSGREKASQALSTDPLNDFPGFVAAVSQRLEKGRDTYGDKSFDKPIGELLVEIEEELLDVCGWSFVLWLKLQSMKSLHDTQYKLQNAANNHDRWCTDQEMPVVSKLDCGAKMGSSSSGNPARVNLRRNAGDSIGADSGCYSKLGGEYVKG